VDFPGITEKFLSKMREYQDIKQVFYIVYIFNRPLWLEKVKSLSDRSLRNFAGHL